jgi:hypothetical protein
MKRVCQLGCLAVLVGAIVAARDDKPAASDDAARAAAVKLWKSLNDDQKKLALCDFSDKDRYAEVFPETKRKGIPYSMLTAEQKVMVEEVVRGMCSDYGAGRCLEVAKQTRDTGRYLTFYGEPEPGKPFAWRIAMHHLTLIYAEFGTDNADEFGPVLLGGNPVKDLWDPEEKILLELRASLSEDEAKKVVGKGNAGSGAAIGTNGVKIAELSEKPKALAKKLLEQRLAVFSVDRRKVLAKLIENDGGAESLRIALWGDASKGQLEGGTYHWKIGGPTVLVDWQTVGKNHIHMTVRGRGKA